jgi:undecaprenyldiphospho-muramoylpentapeptide beta-N-acetylglucosaminyltransferase
METTYCLIAGGGTAGHVLPGLAVADELVSRGHERQAIHFVVSERPIDTELVSGAGYERTTLPGRGIQRAFTLANVAAAWGIVRAFGRALGLVRRRRPSVVLAVGGYASVACAVAAAVLRVPLVVAEQNARAGLANRLAGRFARRCAVPFAGTDLPRATVTGNPVRREILAIDPTPDRGPARDALGLPRDRTVVLAFAGSLGARRINDAVADLARAWRDREDIAIRHVVGSRDWSELEPVLASLGRHALVYQAIRYEDRMPLALAAADVAVCRAGGTTVAELAVVGLPAIFVPLPIAPRDHQTANAAELVTAGAARLIADGELTGERLRLELTDIVDTPGRLEAMSSAASGCGRRDASGRVADLLEEVAR